MENLLSNTAFGGYLETLELSNSAYRMLRKNYDAFLKQPLELWMFVSCDEIGRVLEEPQSIRGDFNVASGHGGFFDQKAFLDYQLKFGQQRNKCLFERFDVSWKESYASIEVDSRTIFWYNSTANIGSSNWIKTNKYHVIEDLVKFDLKLSKASLKQIGL